MANQAKQGRWSYSGVDRRGAGRMGTIDGDTALAHWLERRWRAGWRELVITDSLGEVWGRIEAADPLHKRTYWVQQTLADMELAHA